MTIINLAAHKAYKTEQRIDEGAEKCLEAMAKISNNDPYEAVGMMLLAAAAMAQAIDITRDELQEGFDIACNQCYGEE
jgi:hypothetical protein